MKTWLVMVTMTSNSHCNCKIQTIQISYLTVLTEILNFNLLSDDYVNETEKKIVKNRTVHL